MHEEEVKEGAGTGVVLSVAFDIEGLAQALDTTPGTLKYLLYILRDERKYCPFQIAKKNGGTREILSPIPLLGAIQRRINGALQKLYQPPAPAHGFVPSRSVLTNAKLHLRQRFVLNVDLKDFFPSINFGRVRGLLMAKPYALYPNIATMLAKLCCHDNKLPQGAPTSPILSNMICSRMDRQLLKLAREYRCVYSRYADDITFSTSMPAFPSQIAKQELTDSGPVTIIGSELERVVRSNGFEFNPSKARLQSREHRQQVTGVIVNHIPNVERRFTKQIRAMLHAWETFGLEKAEEEYWTKYRKKNRHPEAEDPRFAKVVLGKLAYLRMIRGKDNSTYRRLMNWVARIDPTCVREVPEEQKNGVTLSPVVFTEGKSDWKHLRAATDAYKRLGKYAGLDFELFDGEVEKAGDTGLLEKCKHFSESSQSRVHIFVFDRDNDSLIKAVHPAGKLFKDWGNQVFSFAIPVPPHRRESPQVCIELCYQDNDLKRPDRSGRRLFLSSEFSRTSGRFLDKSLDLTCSDKNKAGRVPVTVIDNHVYDPDDKNVALPKDDFANLILTRDERFRDLDFTGFQGILSTLEEILKPKEP